jgi:2-polyprenyl-3-methyl-5-hydroxy-6-metoxy-1,4-benzoquinol methylase
MTEIPTEILQHYREADENGRLRSGLGQLEFLRTQAIVRRHLPRRELRIADIGGATGVHAEWLAADGHNVHIFDVVLEHVQAAQLLATTSPRISAEIGDARQLPAPDDTFDAALLLGPLYHLPSRDDRVLALREAGRVVRPGGLVFVATISRFASLFDSLAKGFLFSQEGAEMIEQDLATGQHRNDANIPGWFTTAYFHRPEELSQECGDAGLDVLTVVGVEGMASWQSDLEDRWSDLADRQMIVESAEMIESEESLLGLSPHLIAVAQVQ